jgi:epoxyqueuosine reductase
MPDITTDELVRMAIDAGAATAGVTSADPFGEARETLRSHKTAGLSGPLRFTYADPVAATDIKVSFPWARTVVVVTASYLGRAMRPSSTGGLVARFATADHYETLREICAVIRGAIQQGGARAEVLIDDNRLVDRSAAIRSGAGWRGKSTMVLAPGHGPWLLLGSVVTDLTLELTSPMQRSCGTCVACIPACPTGAITEEGLDARRCLSTWLQTPGSIPLWIRPHLGRRIYGCDDCLTSCPPGSSALSRAPTITKPLAFDTLLGMSDQELLDRFTWWYIPRRDGRFIRRNLLIAAGNSGEDGAVTVIEEHLNHRSSMIRGHAAWALARSRGAGARPELELALARETVPGARSEMETALKMTEPTAPDSDQTSNGSPVIG